MTSDEAEQWQRFDDVKYDKNTRITRAQEMKGM
jgi:hypothetical protein